MEPVVDGFQGRQVWTVGKERVRRTSNRCCVIGRVRSGRRARGYGMNDREIDCGSDCKRGRRHKRQNGIPGRDMEAGEARKSRSGAP